MRAALVVLVGVAAMACSGPGLRAGASPSPTATIGGPGELDPAVDLPAGFPSDLPVYPGARPVLVTTSTAGGTSWEVKWQTLDSLDQVKTFYSAQLNQGDWVVSSEDNTQTAYTATFHRKSNSSYAGLLAVDTTSKQGVTSISVVLLARS
ncbi:MAG TPA: hypothetical protein VKT20_03480 [Candidatus Dormibacteraeota bacterium]|nr:hypothetical protein [Candidatus Dormibacteraeota bacterium]